ncbi:MAG TPA: sugar ABC transporter substrate-binding protein [Actinomycetota bacterium]|jgi:simple sugar transport system substrate-binding protein|nr:sugar ABC transporter substrate-binding protein [Actinomycetota bacterium]
MNRIVALLAASFLLSAACTPGGDDGEETTGGEQRRYSFYVVEHGSSGDPYWEVVKKGAQDAAARYDVRLTWLNPEQFSVQKVVDLLNSAVAANPDGMLVTIIDPAAVDPPIRQAIESGIPVIAIDIPDPRPFPEKLPYLFYIGPDDYVGGRRAAETMLQQGPIERAACAIHEQGSIGLELRCKGFTDVIEEAGGTVDKLDIGQDPSRIQQAEQSYFAANSDATAILTLGPVGAIPTIQFLEDQGQAGEIIHGTFDLDPTTNESIKDGSTLFTIDGQPYLLGYQGIEMLYLHNRYGFTLGGDIVTGPAIVDQSNVEQVEALTEERIR